MKTKKEIILEVSEAYTIHSRAVIKSEIYVSKDHDGNKCAVGRYMIDPQSGDTRSACSIPNLDSKLVEEVRGHEIDFWVDLQRLHDKAQYWDYSGLTEKGEEYRDMLLNRWAS